MAERSNGVAPEKAYRRLKWPMLVKARHWFPSLAEWDLDDLYQSACLSVVWTPAKRRCRPDVLLSRPAGILPLSTGPGNRPWRRVRLAPAT